MKASNVVSIVAASGALFSALMPIASNGPFNAGISHLGDVAKTLYVLPLPALLVAALALHGRMSNPRWWYVSIGAAGTLLSILVVSTAKNHVGFFGSAFGGFSAEVLGGTQNSGPEIAIGGIGIIACYLCLGICGLSYRRTGAKDLRSATDRKAPSI